MFESFLLGAQKYTFNQLRKDHVIYVFQEIINVKEQNYIVYDCAQQKIYIFFKGFDVI